MLLGTLLDSARVRPRLDLANPELAFRSTLDLGVAGQVTQRRASIAQQFHDPIVGADTDKGAKDRRRRNLRIPLRSAVQPHAKHPQDAAALQSHVRSINLILISLAVS